MLKRTEWFLCVFNVYNLAAESVVALAKPVIDVTLLERYEENESVVGQARVLNQHVSGETIERTLPEPLQERLEHSTNLIDNEPARLKELLYDYQHVFSLTKGDLGTTRMVKHRIETGNVPPIRQQPRRTSPWKHDENRPPASREGDRIVRPLVISSCLGD